MTETEIRRILDMVETMLRTPDVKVSIASGVIWRNVFETGTRVAIPHGRAVTIETGGGAVEREETHAEQLERLRASETP
jgi:hypothetical protein